MQPTPKLRFVERIIQFQIEPMSNTTMGKTVRILQQWWEPERNIIDMVAGKTQGEWRDIPLEVEA
jgi:hypothetical protein